MKNLGWREMLFGVVVGLAAAAQGYANAESVDPRQAVFATVNGEVILQSSYDTAVRVAGRQRFYHGKAPEADLVAFRKEVAEQLVVDRLMHQEALARGMAPDQAWVDKEFAKIERKYSVSPQWHESGDSLKQQIRDGLEQRSLIEQVDASYRVVEAPSDDQTRAYYDANPDKFTSPEQIRVSTILLKVEPWQTKDVWDERSEEAQRIHADLKRGGDFAAYAAKYPPQDQAQLGYLHRGMLGDTAQAAIDVLGEGGITDVVTLLEGVAIFRLDERVAAQLNPFEKVKQRAADLLQRETSERLYGERKAALRRTATVTFSDPNFHTVSVADNVGKDTHKASASVQKE